VNGGAKNAAGMGGRGTDISAALAALAADSTINATPANNAPTLPSFAE